VIRPSALIPRTHRPIVPSRAYIPRERRETLSGAVQCFAARSAYWITMNPLTMQRKALKVGTATFAITKRSRKSEPSLCNKSVGNCFEFSFTSPFLFRHTIAGVLKCHLHQRPIYVRISKRVIWINHVYHLSLLIFFITERKRLGIQLGFKMYRLLGSKSRLSIQNNVCRTRQSLNLSRSMAFKCGARSLTQI